MLSITSSCLDLLFFFCGRRVKKYVVWLQENEIPLFYPVAYQTENVIKNQTFGILLVFFSRQFKDRFDAAFHVFLFWSDAFISVYPPHLIFLAIKIYFLFFCV